MKAIALSIAALLLASAPVMAADLVVDIADEELMAVATKWDGVYVGISGIVFSSTTIPEVGVGVSGVIGYNQTFSDNFLFGVEAFGGVQNSALAGTYFTIGGEGRAGVLVNDSVLLYGATGVQAMSGGAVYGTLGGGLEFAATDALSVDLEYKYFVGLNTGWRGHQVGASVNWHF